MAKWTVPFLICVGGLIIGPPLWLTIGGTLAWIWLAFVSDPREAKPAPPRRSEARHGSYLTAAEIRALLELERAACADVPAAQASSPGGRRRGCGPFPLAGGR